MAQQRFGQVLLNASDVFFKTSLTMAFVNLKPILPGHVLVSPRRVVPRFIDLSQEEVSDLFKVVHQIGPILQEAYGATSLTIAIQDGPEAGQSIEHVHVHVIPRKKGDFSHNDEIYEHLHNWSRIEDEKREARSPEEMAKEAEYLKIKFSSQ